MVEGAQYIHGIHGRPPRLLQKPILLARSASDATEGMETLGFSVTRSKGWRGQESLATKSASRFMLSGLQPLGAEGDLRTVEVRRTGGTVEVGHCSGGSQLDVVSDIVEDEPCSTVAHQANEVPALWQLRVACRGCTRRQRGIRLNEVIDTTRLGGLGHQEPDQHTLDV